MKLAKLAEFVGGRVHGDPDCLIQGASSLLSAKAGDLTFFLSKSKLGAQLSETSASAVVLTAENLERCPCHALITENPELSFAKILLHFEKLPKQEPGIHPSSVIGSDCDIDPSVVIAAHCVIGHQVSIAPNTVISAGTVVGDNVKIGCNSYFHPNVTVYHDVMVGERVIIHSGVVLGSDGFGLARDRDGCWVRIPQLGRVVVGDGVEIGANTTVDRAALEDTIIGEGVKIDNQVQIAHNVQIGAHTVIAGCVGIAGSAKIGQYCMIGGGSCINGHITLADQVVITGMSRVIQSITTPGVYSSGTVLQNSKDWRKSSIYFKRLGDFVTRLKRIERLFNK